MNKNDIVRMAQEAGLGNSLSHNGDDKRVWIEGADWHDEVERFAALVAAEKDKEIERLREALHDISISQNSMYQEARAKQALGEDQNIWRMCGVNTDDVIKMAEEAGIVMSLTDERVTLNKLNRFLELHLKALRNDGYRKCAEGQRTTQFCGLLDGAVKAEREACAKVCKNEEATLLHKEGLALPQGNPMLLKMASVANFCAAAIRARGGA